MRRVPLRDQARLDARPGRDERCVSTAAAASTPRDAARPGVTSWAASIEPYVVEAFLDALGTGGVLAAAIVRRGEVDRRVGELEEAEAGARGVDRSQVTEIGRDLYLRASGAAARVDRRGSAQRCPPPRRVPLAELRPESICGALAELAPPSSGDPLRRIDAVVLCKARARGRVLDPLARRGSRRSPPRGSVSRREFRS